MTGDAEVADSDSLELVPVELGSEDEDGEVAAPVVDVDAVPVLDVDVVVDVAGT